MPMTPLFNKAQLPIERYSGLILSANQQLDLARGGLLLRPIQQGGEQALAVTLTPMAQVNAHVQAQDMRNVPQAHGIQAGMRNTSAVLFHDKVLGPAFGGQCHTFGEGCLREFVGLRDQQAIELANDCALRLA